MQLNYFYLLNFKRPNWRYDKFCSRVNRYNWKGMRYFDLLLERFKEREKYINNLDYYLNIIKKFFKEKFGDDAKIYLFGSYLTKNFGPNSDIDILVIKKGESLFVRDKSEIIAELRRIIGFVNPFEIHIVSEEEYDEWYSKFIKEKREI